MMKRIVLLMQAGLLMADPLTLVISNETAPAGSTAQIRIWASLPAAITQGRISMDFDAATFGDIDTVAVFGAAGDAYGAATVQNRHLDVQFNSPSGGIGRLPDLPILVVSVPVLAGAAQSAVTLDPSLSAWKDPQGNAYTVTVTPAVFTVGGNLAIARVEPGGGVQPAGTVIRITGVGFAANPAVEVTGVSIASTQFVSPQEIDLTLGAPAEMTGKRVRLRNSDGAEAVFFASLHHSLELTASKSTVPIQPIFPLRTFSVAAGDFRSNVLGLSSFLVVANPGSAPVDVTVEQVDLDLVAVIDSFTVPAGGVEAQGPLGRPIPGSFSLISASAPVHMIRINIGLSTPPRLSGVFAVVPAYRPAPQVRAASAISFSMVRGSAPPAPQTLPVAPVYRAVDFSVSAATASGGQWLFVSPSSGRTCGDWGACQPPTLKVAVDPSSLSAGSYSGTITLTPAGADATPSITTVRLDLLDSPSTAAITVGPPRLDLRAVVGTRPLSFQNAPEPQLQVESGPTPAQVQVQVATEDGSAWLKVRTVGSHTPLGLTVVADASQLAPGLYRGSITITGPAGPVAVPVTLTVSSPATEPLALGTLVNAASQRQGAVAPGEIVTIHASATDTITPASLVLNTDGKVAAKLGGVRVLFDGTPAPLIAVSGSLIAAIVPYEVGNSSSTNLELEYNTVRSAAVGVPVAPTAPAILAVLNEDYSMNDPSNPAARGSIIQIYGTGEGLTEPPGVTGSIIHGDLKRPIAPVTVTIGDMDAPVLYAGSAGESVAGLFQVNVRVPEKAGNLPVVLTVGGAHSQEGVSIAVR